jgi:hypothetical protein
MTNKVLFGSGSINKFLCLIFLNSFIKSSSFAAPREVFSSMREKILIPTRFSRS